MHHGEDIGDEQLVPGLHQCAETAIAHFFLIVEVVIDVAEKLLVPELARRNLTDIDGLLPFPHVQDMLQGAQKAVLLPHDAADDIGDLIQQFAVDEHIGGKV